MNRATKLKIAGLCGVAGPLIAFSMILLAISSSPWFSWTVNALSDLGARGVAAPLFNSGLIICGVLILLFATGLGKILPGRFLSRAGVLGVVLSAIALIGIGVFPEPHALHLPLSVAFFTLLPISMLIIGCAMALEPPERKIGLLIITLGVVAIVSWAFLFAIPLGSAAILETVATLAASACVIVLGVKLFIQAQAISEVNKRIKRDDEGL